MDDFERAWRKQLAAEKKYIDERSRRSDSRLNRFLQTKVPEKLKDTLDTGFAKAFELIFAKGTGVIEKTYNRRDIERSSRVRRIIAENNPSGRALNEASRGSYSQKLKNTVARRFRVAGAYRHAHRIPVFTGCCSRACMRLRSAMAMIMTEWMKSISSCC